VTEASEPERPKGPEPGSIAELLGRLVDDAEAFVRAEIRLYRVEAIHKVNSYRPLLALAIFGGLLAFGSVTLLLMALVFALAPYLGAAWSALIVALVALALSGLLIGVVAARIRRDLGDDSDEDEL
jgi:pilus assembly protein TadC